MTAPSTLDASAFAVTFPRPLGDQPTPAFVLDLLRPGASAAMQSDDGVRGAVRDLLREGGYKPTGRGKPSSEYLLRAVAEGKLGSINAAVDLGNAVSLHSGLPISVVDLAKAVPPLRIAVPGAGAKYVFNAGGQEIEVEGLVCLHDAEGPCANAVKDAQRTKTDAATTRTLFVLWGTRRIVGRSAATAQWLGELCRKLGASFEATPLA